MPKRYHGGLWLSLDKKPAVDRPIDELSAPARVVIPLLQHRGEPAALCVHEGDRVLLGQPVGTGAGDSSCSVHSSVSGTVTDIAELVHPLAGSSQAVVIQSDGEDTPYEYAPARRDAFKMEPDEIIARIRTVAVASTRGLEPPLWRRLSDMAQKRVRTLVVNAVESEPYICGAQKRIEEEPERIASGLFAMVRAAGCKNAVLAVSDDYGEEPEDVVKAASLRDFAVKLVRVPSKYPSGFDEYLLHFLTGRSLAGPPSFDTGEYGFVSAEDCFLVARAIELGSPQTSCIVTVSGNAVANPQVFEIRLGTSVRDVLERCGLSFEPERVVLGSAMRGTAIDDLHTPVTKPVNAILALRPSSRRRQPSLCINCGKCARVCPRGLYPHLIALSALNADWDACSQLHIEDCIECGSCSYICPGRMPVVELIKNLKKAHAAESGTRA